MRLNVNQWREFFKGQHVIEVVNPVGDQDRYHVSFRDSECAHRALQSSPREFSGMEVEVFPMPALEPHSAPSPAGGRGRGDSERRDRQWRGRGRGRVSGRGGRGTPRRASAASS